MTKKEIVDSKTIYLVKTLSRTKRKDYENYVINAIWHKLNNINLEVVSQQYIEDIDKSSNRSHYFIDLYFPSLNIGIECDEAFHKDQKDKDKEREVTIFDVLYKINQSKYEAIHIDVTQSFDLLQRSIDDAVTKINLKAKEVNPIVWDIQSPEDYYRDKSRIQVSDRKGFRSINKTCNVLFSAGRDETSKGASRAYFSLPKFKGTSLNGYKMWFPKLAIQFIDKNGNVQSVAATKTGWNNILLEEGKVIREYNEHDKSAKIDGRKRIVFAKYKDPLGFNEYKFLGIFEFRNKEANHTYFKRISESCKLIKI